ncbi:MAG TPA: hypothetical protein VMQ65_07865 [Candidatus Limnocylindria bacterium]|nr:hypothetical protein [Candidatus Limnocylindria bacterium]
MEERFVPIAQAEGRPIETGDHRQAEPAESRRPIDDPRALQILSTDHWSLLTARSLVYNEAFARAGMFLAFLSATLLVLGLISNATGFTDGFLIVAASVLALDLFVGLATLGRIIGASSEDLRYLQGMSRLRHAYFEIVPGLEPYFITNGYDDFDSVARFYGPRQGEVGAVGEIAHGLTTAPGMISVICSAVAAGLVATLALLLTHDAILAVLAGLAGFVVCFLALGVFGYRSATSLGASMPAMFPRPKDTAKPRD